MKPVTREEQYLNRLTGEEQEIPEEPVTREEQYLARLCGQMNSIPEKPVTRREEYLANLCGEDVIIPEEQVTRMEQYMAFAAGARETKPEKPVTREEMYWDKYQGGDVPEEKTIAFTDIITVTDALARPAVDLQTEITATQNLNGYDYPWPAGGGKNKLPNEALSRTINGLTFIKNDDGTVIVNGTASALTEFIFFYDSGNSFPYNGYILTGCPSGYEQNLILRLSDVEASSTSDYGSGTPIVLSDTGKWSALIIVRSGTTVNNAVFKPMIRLNGTDPAYAPYENICPISGRTEVNVTRTGKNLCYVSDSHLFPRGDNLPIVNNASLLTAYAKVPKNTNLVFSCATEPQRKIAFGFTEEPQVGTISHTLSFTVLTTTSYAFNSGEYEYVAFYYGSTDYPQTNVQIELGSTATEYEPYEGDTFNTELGRTVYGGTLDLTTGELKITHAYVDLGDLTWTTSFSEQIPNLFGAYINNKKDGYRNFITTSYRTVKKHEIALANGEATGITKTIGEPMTYIFVKDERATTAEEFTALVTGQKMVYELATPQTISLTPTEVMMLENNNTIWADSGRVQLTYLSKAAQRVRSMNASLQANALKLSGIKITKRTPTM